MQVIDLAAFTDGDDVGMIEGGSGLGLAFKSKYAALVAMAIGSLPPQPVYR
jgi:hypothetical protein